MGITLFGIDLDDSRVGRSLRRLLTDEDVRRLEAMADGGSVDGTDSDDRGSVDDTGPDDDTTEYDTDSSSDTSDEFEADGDDQSGPDSHSGSGPESYSGSGPDSQSASSPASNRRSAADSDPRSTPEPPTDTSSTESDFEGVRAPTTSPDEESDGKFSKIRRFVSRHRRQLLIAGAGTAAVAVLAVLVRRLVGRFRSSDEDAQADDTSDETDTGTGDRGPDVEAERPIDERSLTDDESSDDGESPFGPLLGLAFLAFVAAMVRKFGESDDGERSA